MSKRCILGSHKKMVFLVVRPYPEGAPHSGLVARSLPPPPLQVAGPLKKDFFCGVPREVRINLDTCSHLIRIQTNFLARVMLD